MLLAVVEVLTLRLGQRIECSLEFVLQGVVLSHRLKGKIADASPRQNIFDLGGLGRTN